METKTKKPTTKQLALNVSEIGDTKLIGFLSAEYNTPKKVCALAAHLGLTLEEAFTIVETDYDTFEYGSQEYLVCTDSEADNANDQSIENYIDECILPELDERYRMYFDNEKFMRDARMDGRGHNLATYDGHENYETVDGETLYIYRTN